MESADPAEATPSPWPLSKPEDPPLSLLWPPGSVRLPAAAASLDAGAGRHIGLQGLVAALAPSSDHRPGIRRFLTSLCRDPAVLTCRKAVLQDLPDSPELAAKLEELLPSIASKSGTLMRRGPSPSRLHKVAWRLSELEDLVSAVEGLDEALGGPGSSLQSAGLGGLRQLLSSIASHETFRSLARDLPDLLAQARAATSVTLGVNLDQRPRPDEATLLAVNSRKFRG